MRPVAMIIPVIALTAWIQLLPAPSAAQDNSVEVTFRCPPATGILTFDWRNPLGGEYTEGGKRHDLKFKLNTMSMAPTVSTSGPKRNGNSIRCDYSSTGSASTLHASYFYEVHREIISCASDGGNLVCKLKP